MNIVNIPTKYYVIADMVFVNSLDTQITEEELKTINERFSDLVAGYDVSSGEN